MPRRGANEAGADSKPKGRASRTVVLTVRLSADELAEIEAAAAREGETPSEYVRRAVAMRAGSASAFKPQVNLSVSMPYMQINNLTTWSESNSDQAYERVDIYHAESGATDTIGVAPSHK